MYAATFGRGIWSSEIPSFSSINITIGKSRVEPDLVKVDGKLTVLKGRKYIINSKLVITKGSKIELRKGAKLILSSKERVVNEQNKKVSIEQFVIKHKTAQIIYQNN
jgi:hypothetical protein